MGLIRGFFRETRKGAPKALRRAALLLLLPMLVASIFVGVQAWSAWRDSGIDGDVMGSVPVEAMVAGHVQALDCIRVGADVCPQYDQAKSYLVRASSEDGVTYTPLDGQEAPGEPQDDDTRRLVLSQDLSDNEWHAFAAAATRDGLANVTTVPDTNVSVLEMEGSFRLEDGPGLTWLGTMAFDVAQNGLILRQITYDISE